MRSPVSSVYGLGFLLAISGLAADIGPPSSDEILARVEIEYNRRHLLLKEYSGSRQYTLQNARFGRQAAVAVLMNYRQLEGERYTIVTRSGSDKLNGIIDKVLTSEAGASMAPENARHQIAPANYRARMLGTEVTAGRNCYVLELAPRTKSRYLIVGKAWIDTGSYAVVRIEGQFAANISILVGSPRIREEFVEVHGFWLPGHVRSVSTSILLGPTELEILFSNYQIAEDLAALEQAKDGGPAGDPFRLR
jgi:MucB/RseB N-terminal domain